MSGNEQYMRYTSDTYIYEYMGVCVHICINICMNAYRIIDTKKSTFLNITHACVYVCCYKPRLLKHSENTDASFQIGELEM